MKNNIQIIICKWITCNPMADEIGLNQEEIKNSETGIWASFSTVLSRLQENGMWRKK